MEVSAETVRSSTVAQRPSLTPASSRLLQRKCACGGTAPGGECDSCKQQDLLRRQPIGPDAGAYGAVPPSVHEVLRSPGNPLPPASRAFFESGFGHDFAKVRIHTDARASDSARNVNARAYTVGRDIVFGRGEYDPQSSAGRHLLAHELAHVVQQSGAGSAGEGVTRIGDANDAAESHAEHAANLVASAHRTAALAPELAHVLQQGGSRPLSGPATIQRQHAPDHAKKDSDCNIHNPRAYVYFEIARRFYNPNDNNPEVVKRANCLKEAFKLLSPADAVEFSLQIIRKKGIYESYETLATPTRLALAQILVDVLNQKTTEAYLARLLSALAVTPEYNATLPAPAIVTAKIASPDGLTITLDKSIVAAATAELLGPSECDKFTLGFTQFSTEDYFVTDYYDSKLKSYLTIDEGPKMKPYMPCQDVFNVGDIWSYSKKLDCGSKDVTKKFAPDKTPDQPEPLYFSDSPTEATPLFSR